MALTDGLIAYYKFDESSGNAADATGNGHTATVYSYSRSAGKIGNALTGVGTTEIATDAAMKPAEFTITAWVKTGVGTNIYPLLLTGNSSSARVRLSVGDGNVASFSINNSVYGTSTHYGNTYIPRGEWCFICCSFDGSDQRIFFNGSEDAGSLNFPHAITYSTDSCGMESADPYSVGTQQLDEVGFWNRALTFGEIASLYRSGAGYQYPFPTMIALGTGAFTLSMKDILIKRTLKLVASVGEFALSGVDFIFRTGKALVAQTGQFILSGKDIGWTDTRKWKNNERKSQAAYNNNEKSDSTFTNKTKSSSSFTNQSKNASTFVNQSKSLDSWVNESKS